MNTQYVSITKSDEDKFLKHRIGENRVFSQSFTYQDVISWIDSGELTLQVNDTEATKVIDDSKIEMIFKAMDNLIAITAKPRSIIKSINDKVPVDTAKRISYKAVVELSKDSHDWYYRTITSVKPKTVLAELNEETQNTYENRVVCTLIKRIGRLIIEAKNACRFEMESIRRDLARQGAYDGYELQRMVPISGKIQSNQYGNGDPQYVKLLEDRSRMIEKTEKKLNILKDSKLFKDLQKIPEERNPVQRTNIFLFDHNYNEAYQLWNDLNKVITELKPKVADEEIPVEELSRYYVLYVFITLCEAFHILEFDETSGNRMTFSGSSGLTLSGNLSFVNEGGWQTIDVDLKNNTIRLSIPVEEKFSKTGRIETWIDPRYYNMEKTEP